MSKDLLQRFNFIEQVAWWEGKINSSHIIEQFNLSRQSASKVLQQYKHQKPHNLHYDDSIKGYIPSDHFNAEQDLNNFSEYLAITSQSHTTVSHFFHEVDAPLRNINPLQVRPILRAIREKLAIDIGYISLSSPDYLERIISPHSLIFDGLRWHVRAYCHKNEAFRDFTLSRFNATAEFEGTALKTIIDDLRWNTFVEIVIQPDPRLSAKQQQIIAHDFQMENQQKRITIRSALVNYLLLRLRLDSYKNTPEEQQIVLTTASRKAIQPYLPKPH